MQTISHVSVVSSLPFSHTPPEGMQMVRDDEVFKKALIPATWLEEETIQGRRLLPGGVPHLKEVDKEKMANEVWATPGFVQGMSFYFRHHGRYYKMVPGEVLYAYLIFDTNDKFAHFKQLTCYGIAPGHESSFAELKMMNSLSQMRALKLQLVMMSLLKVLHTDSLETTEIWKLCWIFPFHDEIDISKFCRFQMGYGNLILLQNSNYRLELV